MKILIVSKRQYTNRDLLDDRYGRLFELPEELSQLGNEVKGLCISYRKKKEGAYQPKNVSWKSINALPFLSTKKIVAEINSLIKDFKPDIVWVSSDVFIIISTGISCKNFNIPFVIDFYDNYESFLLTKLPFVKHFLLKACRKAAGITTVTAALSNLIKETYAIEYIPVVEIGNSANSALFFPRDMHDSRVRLGLPLNGVLIGTAGALNKSRGIKTLFEAFELLERENPNLFLVVAGPRDKTVENFKSRRIIDLGVISPEMVSYLFNSLNLAIICNVHSDFGDYCYPQKYEEIIACNVPVLAADVGELSLKLADKPNMLFRPEDAIDLSKKITLALNDTFSNKSFHSKITWGERAKTLNNFLLQVKN